MAVAKHMCLKLEVPTAGGGQAPVFVKGTWFPARFGLAVTDGLHAWTCNATEEEVRKRASNWDLTVPDYIEFAERYLGFQQPGSVYSFSDAGNGCKRLSWTFEKGGVKLEWRWKLQPSSSSKETTVEILDFLMDSNIKLSEEVVWRKQEFEKLEEETEKCLAQSERLCCERSEFETETYGKFVQVLSSKKEKLRELRDRLSKEEEAAPRSTDNESASTERTETIDEGSEQDSGEARGKTSRVAPTRKPRGRKRR